MRWKRMLRVYLPPKRVVVNLAGKRAVGFSVLRAAARDIGGSRSAW